MKEITSEEFEKELMHLLNNVESDNLLYRTYDGCTIEESEDNNNFTDTEIGWAKTTFNDCDVDVLCLHYIWSDDGFGQYHGGCASMNITGWTSIQVWDKIKQNISYIDKVFE